MAEHGNECHEDKNLHNEIMKAWLPQIVTTVNLLVVILPVSGFNCMCYVLMCGSFLHVWALLTKDVRLFVHIGIEFSSSVIRA